MVQPRAENGQSSSALGVGLAGPTASLVYAARFQTLPAGRVRNGFDVNEAAGNDGPSSCSTALLLEGNSDQ